MKQVLCKDCKFYQAGKDEMSDICTHAKSNHLNIRSHHHYSCYAMRAGICDRGMLFEPSEAYAEYLRDQKIEANQERRQDRAEERESRRGFEENEGARE